LDGATGDGRQHEEVTATGGASDEDDYEPSLGPEPEEKGDFELDAQDELHEEYEEDGIRLGLQSPVKPNSEEIRQHNVSHVPYRSWCQHCVRGKGRTLAHKSGARGLDKARDVRPRIFMDYFYLGRKEEPNEALPLLAILDQATQRVFSVSLPMKGLGHQYNAAVVAKLIKILGHQHSVLKTDTERSLVALRTAVQQQLPNLSFEDAIKGESQTNGPIESAVGRLQAQARTLKSALEFNYELAIPPRHPILCWLVDYCGTLLSRFQRGADGRTPYERSTGKAWKIKLPEFGECILYQPLKGERERGKLEAKFEKGIYLGIQEGTGMRWVGTPNGVVRTWTTKTLAEEDKWQAEIFENFVGLPWQLKMPVAREAGMKPVPDLELDIELPGQPEVPAVQVEKKQKGYIPRGVYIRRDVELKQYGYTDGCDGCDAAKHGLSHRQHSRACKKRISEQMAKTQEGQQRLDRIKEREEKFIVAYQQAEEKKRTLDADDGKSSKAVKVAPDLEDILGDVAVPVADDDGGQGGPSDSQPSGVVVPVPDSDMEDEIEADDAGAHTGEGVEPSGSAAPSSMDIGSLHVRSVGGETSFKEAVREASLCETADMMMDEEIDSRRLLLQVGAISRRDAYDFGRPAIVELFSPPRVTDYARRMRVGDGVAMDLTTVDEQGRPWNFSLEDCRRRATELVEWLDPDLLIGSPPCGPYSQLQALNENKMDPQKRAETLAEAEQHLEFCAEQYAKRHARQKLFLHEHPALAKSWKSEAIRRVENLPGVLRVTGDMCEQGMELEDDHGPGLAKKSTTYLTNSEFIAEELSKQCSNEPDALAVWRQTAYDVKRGQKVQRGGPAWSSVRRRVTLDLESGILLQDLKDVHNASPQELKFKLPEGCTAVETIFYFVRAGRKWHRHIPLMGGKAKQCEVYPNGLIRSILRGLRKHLRQKIPLSALDFGPVNQEQDLDLGLVEDWETFTDEVSGKALEKSMVMKARREEIEYAERYNVWTVVPVSEAYEVSGKAPIGTRWIDINKGDVERPAYRSRLVVQEVRQSNIEAIFAATPPLESVRMLLSLQRTGKEVDKKGRRKKVMFIDVRRAHWCAKIFRAVFVWLPEESGVGDGMCGRLNKAMYGCRDAAAS
jgi:hypothetical protein